MHLVKVIYSKSKNLNTVIQKHLSNFEFLVEKFREDFGGHSRLYAEKLYTNVPRISFETNIENRKHGHFSPSRDMPTQGVDIRSWIWYPLRVLFMDVKKLCADTETIKDYFLVKIIQRICFSSNNTLWIYSNTSQLQGVMLAIFSSLHSISRCVRKRLLVICTHFSMTWTLWPQIMLRKAFPFSA